MVAQHDVYSGPSQAILRYVVDSSDRRAHEAGLEATAPDTKASSTLIGRTVVTIYVGEQMKYLCLGSLMLLVAGLAAGQDDNFEMVFDGHSLSGWEGNESLWRVDDHAILGGTLEGVVVADEFLCTERDFRDFELRLEARMSGAQTNGGVSFRGHRIQNSTEVGGYQADMGFIPGQLVPIVSDLTGVDPHELYPLWGSLLDEYRPEKSRYPDPQNPYRLIAIADRALVDRTLRPIGWNRVTVTAIGDRIEIGLNGVKTVEYVEQGDVPRDGHICLQIHSGPPSEARYRNVRIRTR